MPLVQATNKVASCSHMERQTQYAILSSLNSFAYNLSFAVLWAARAVHYEQLMQSIQHAIIQFGCVQVSMNCFNLPYSIVCAWNISNEERI